MNDKILDLYKEADTEKKILEAENNALKEKMAKDIVTELNFDNSFNEYYTTRVHKKPLKMRMKAFFKKLFSSF